jgi:hypothetical protein
MSSKVTVSLDDSLYTEDAVRETAAAFAEVVQVSVRRRKSCLVVTLECDGDADPVAGEFVNIALARTLEARSS